MNKLSFKTTTLIAAIGMSIAAIFFLAEYAMSNWFGLWDIIVSSMPERIIRNACRVINLLSMAIFFWGVYNYPSALPKRNKWSLAVGCIATLALAFEFASGCMIPAFSYGTIPNIFYWHELIVPVILAVTLWLCHAYSSNDKTSNATQYFALACSTAYIVATAVMLSHCISYVLAWPKWWMLRDIVGFFYLSAIFIGAWTMFLLTIIRLSDYPFSETEVVWKRARWAKRFGRLLLVLYVACITGLVLLTGRGADSGMKEDILFITICLLPVLTAALLIYAGTLLRNVDKHFLDQYCRIHDLENACDDCHLGLKQEEPISGDELLKKIALQYEINLKRHHAKDGWNRYEFKFLEARVNAFAHTTSGMVLLRCYNIETLDFTPENRLAAIILCARYSQDHLFVKLVCDYSEEEQKIYFHLHYDTICAQRQALHTLLTTFESSILDVFKAIDDIRYHRNTFGTENIYIMANHIIPEEPATL